MNIEIIKIKCGCYQADCKDCPGTPPVGYGKTKIEALIALFYLLMFDKPNAIKSSGYDLNKSWLPYINQTDPIIVNGKIWKDPIKSKR